MWLSYAAREQSLRPEGKYQGGEARRHQGEWRSKVRLGWARGATCISGLSLEGVLLYQLPPSAG